MVQVVEQWLARINKLASWQAALIIAAVGFAVFFTGLSSPFQGDDISQIVVNPVVHSIGNIRLFFEGSTFYNGQGIVPLTGIYYRPLMTTAFSFLYTFFGPRPIYFHIFQLILCVTSAILLFLVFKYFFNPLLSLVLTLVFLLHPINSQVVYALPAMQDALFFFFGVLAIWSLLRFRSTRSLFFVVLCLLFSLLSKEAGSLFIVVTLLYLFWFDRKRLFPFIGIVALPIILYLALKVHAVGLSGHPHNAPIDGLNILGRLNTVPSILLFDFEAITFPLKLAHAYYWVYPSFSHMHVLIPSIIDMVIIVSLIYLTIFIRKNLASMLFLTYLFFLSWFSIGLIVHLQILPLDMTACDAWLYFSIAGALGMIGVVIVAFQSRIQPGWFFAIVVIVLCLFGVRTALRGTDWSSEVTLAYRDLAVSKEDYRSEITISTYLLDHGALSQAEEYAKRSINIHPATENYNNLGIAYVRQGNHELAKTAFQRALGYSPSYLVYDNLALLETSYGAPADSRVFIMKSLTNFPQDAKLWMSLAIVEYNMGHIDEAKYAIQKAQLYGRTNLTDYIYETITINAPLNLSQ